MSEVHYYFLAFILTACLVHALKKPAGRFGLVDVPGGRKQHDGAIPIVGGLAMGSAFLISVLVSIDLSSHYAGLLAATALLLAVGVIDDLCDLSARTKFLAQIVAGLIMVLWGDVYLSNLGDLFGNGSIVLNSAGAVFTVFCAIGVINALNMADGLDGLAGGLALITLASFGLLAALSGLTAQASLLCLLIGAVVGFLCFNLRHPWRARASVFMGDAGSMMLGLAIAWFAVELSQGEQAVMTPITALWTFALPLMDTLSVMTRRVLKGVSPFYADRGHLHHFLLRSGCSHGQAVAILLTAAALLGLVGVAGDLLQVPEFIMFDAFLILFLAYHLTMRHVWKVAELQGTLPSRPMAPSAVAAADTVNLGS